MKKFIPIQAAHVARAIISISENEYKIRFFESDKLLEISNKLKNAN